MKNNDIKFETLKKQIRKKIIIGSIAVLAIVSAITLTTSRAKFRLTQSIPVVRGYINFKFGKPKTTVIKISNDKTNYIDTTNIPSSGYEFNEAKSTCVKFVDGVETTNYKISMTYNNGIITYTGINIKNTKCYLYFDKKGITTNDLLATVKSKSNGTKSSFSSVATSNEGIFEASDGMYGGTSYYWRGAVTDNHVIFANYCWRIIRINGDGTIRMIYNGESQSGNTCLGNEAGNKQIGTSAYHANANNNSTFVGWTYSSEQRPSASINNGSTGTTNTIKSTVETWYNTNIGYENSPYANKVATGKYCNDREVENGKTWAATGGNVFKYATYIRMYTNYSPTLSCSNDGDTYELKVGLITADEVEFAGGINANNTNYYLYSGSWYWTMSPSDWKIFNIAAVFIVNQYGYMREFNVNSSEGGVRPVINLSTLVTFNSGSDGTQNNPYIVQ